MGPDNELLKLLNRNYAIKSLFSFTILMGISNASAFFNVKFFLI